MKYLVLSIFSCAVNYLYVQGASNFDKIDARIELTCIVFRLSGAEEFTHVYFPDRIFKMYLDSIDEYFRKYEKHSAVQFAGKLKKQGIGYHYAMYLPLIITEPPNMEIVVPISEGKTVYRWDFTTAREFLIHLNHFYHDSDFEKFLQNNKPLFEVANVRFSEMTSRINTDWFKTFYGYGSEFDFKIINALSIGPNNYSVDVEYLHGKKSSFAILGSSQTDSLGMPVYNERYQYVLVHEFNHSFVNPLIYENEELFKKSGMKIYRYFKKQKIATNVAYGNWQSVLCESIVRAAVITYLKENEYDQSIVDTQIKLEKEKGFPWVEALSETIDNYAADRKKYKDMTLFIPELISFFEELKLNLEYE